MSTLSLKGLTSVCCKRNAWARGCDWLGIVAGERIAGWPLKTQLQCKANIHTTLQHQHPAAACITVNTKDQLSKRTPFSLAPLSISCWSRGFLMFFLKSGSAVSTYNVRLCPRMLPASILIATVLLSTSSITSNPRSTCPSSSEKTLHIQFLLPVASLLFMRRYSTAKQCRIFNPRTKCRTTLSVRLLVSCLFT